MALNSRYRGLLQLTWAALTLTAGPAAWGDPSGSRWSGELTVKQLEWQDSSGPDSLLWNVSGWVGTASNRLWLRDEGGSHVAGAPRDNRLELLWGHPTAWWEWMIGVRQDTGTTPSRTYAALGIQASAPFGINVEATGYLGHGSRNGNNVHAGYRLQAERDWLLGSRFTLGTRAEYELWSEDHVRYSEGVGPSGWSGGVRLGYALGRNIAPYVGAEWCSFIGDTANLASQAGESEREMRLVAGLRLRF
jgi:copper resistance protein B